MDNLLSLDEIVSLIKSKADKENRPAGDVIKELEEQLKANWRKYE